jgi:HAD superfamily phosphoserine phosphatase-like hydrolase
MAQRRLKRKFGRKKQRIAAFDLDGSLVREQLLILLFDEFIALGIFDRAVGEQFTQLFVDHRNRKISFHSFDEAMVRLFNSKIAGKRVEEMREAAKKVAAKHHDWLYTFSRELLATVRPTHQCITITGALDDVVSELVPFWGFEYVYASVLNVEDGVYTGGEKSLPVLRKHEVLKEHVERRSSWVTLAGSIAIGDTSSDIPMLSLVTHPIAFNPTHQLADEAEKRGWPIVVERKSNIYVFCDGSSARFNMDDVKNAVRYVLKHTCTCR